MLVQSESASGEARYIASGAVLVLRGGCQEARRVLKAEL